MLQTLFYIPNEIGGVPLFGVGILLAIWAVGSVVLLLLMGRRQGFNAETWGFVPVLAVVGVAIWWVLPKLCEDPGLPIRGYGMMLLLAVSTSVALAVYRARRRGLDAEMIFSLAFWAFVPGIIGARLFYVIEYWPQFASDRWIDTLGRAINVAQGGLVVYGSFIGASLGLAAFLYTYRMPALATLDLITPSLMLGLGIGRLGCFLNGCCFGGPCDLPWHVTFPEGSPAHVHQMQQGDIFYHGMKITGPRDGMPIIVEVEPGSDAAAAGLVKGQTIWAINTVPVRSVEDAHHALLEASPSSRELSVSVIGGPTARWALSSSAVRSQPIHPTQLYSTLNGLILCLFLVAFDPFARRDGQLGAMMLTLYPTTRFLLEIIRTDESSFFGTGLSISQNISLVLIVCAIALWFSIQKMSPKRAFATVG